MLLGRNHITHTCTSTPMSQWCGGVPGARSEHSTHKTPCCSTPRLHTHCFERKKNRVSTCGPIWAEIMLIPYHMQNHTLSTKHYTCRHTSCAYTGKCGAKTSLKKKLVYVYVQVALTLWCVSCSKCVSLLICGCASNFPCHCVWLCVWSVCGCVWAMHT